MVAQAGNAMHIAIIGLADLYATTCVERVGNMRARQFYRVSQPNSSIMQIDTSDDEDAE